ncbi:nuclear transport factor 2 family protein [Gordonia sp. zg691]|uniref:Nuclear transport factor 2 family protein n=1 Tax=Gordonia jinghuaiqii TaxID=2758710 RepID=A0A7D7QGJ4_9ACTN|nr:nuclear transport factor 2 family protein [Gordonia jinghuaiqii]MBD0860702.1 nuclear transport factor 2 family protein [Gordonia jinghuaiqii]MCR5978033.1 nuclear transport factor 2 family protein [Gordonia jinghuaiqii]QMT01502.1 nuclear transport factor 2 family protein [Gordonia jinghuaiqii]
MSDVTRTIAALTARIETLEAEAEIRRLQARYMFLCDTPCPEFGLADDAERIELIVDLYTDDAVWEGVGEYYDGQFGRAVGKQAIGEHFRRFWGEKKDPALLLNAHYLTSEQIHVDGDEATGQWIHMQPWLFDDGTALLRSSRLNNAFRKEDGRWRVSRTRTENVFIAPLKKNFASDHPSTSVLMRD